MKFTNLFSPVHLSEDPAVGSDGQIYFNTVDNKYRVFYNDQWNTLLDEYTFPVVESFHIGSASVTDVTIDLSSLYIHNIITVFSASNNYINIGLTNNSEFPLGSYVDVIRGGPGEVIFNPESGVTLRQSSSVYLTAAWQTARILKTGTNEWVLDTEFPDIY